MSAAMGIRQTFGLFIDPLSFSRGVPVTLIAFAFALHNLVWGIAQPIAGAASDRFGAAPVVAFGAVAFATGLLFVAFKPMGILPVIAMGLLVGIGISCTSFGVVMTAVGRAASAEKRSMAMGLASSGGSVGQALMVPLAQSITDVFSVSVSLIVLALLMLVAAPFGILLDRSNSGQAACAELPAPPLHEVLAIALRHRGFLLLTAGFTACGFQLAFIATYLPGYLTLCQMPLALGATALGVIGLFNMLGSWFCGWLGGRFRQQYVLALLYLVRAAAIAVFVILPKTDASVLIFSAVMGFVWLGTVPLTSAWVANVFGTRHLGALFGVVFLGHQIGSFFGAWMGGYVFDMTGSYSIIWIATSVAGVIAAMLHFPIKDTPISFPTAAH